jgi:hypothetical protein
LAQTEQRSDKNVIRILFSFSYSGIRHGYALPDAAMILFNPEQDQNFPYAEITLLL